MWTEITRPKYEKPGPPVALLTASNISVLKCKTRLADRLP